MVWRKVQGLEGTISNPALPLGLLGPRDLPSGSPFLIAKRAGHDVNSPPLPKMVYGESVK